MSEIVIRRYKATDLPAVIILFKEAVAAINVRHYTPEQIAVWTDIDETKWHQKFEKNIAYVAECDGVIVGIADMTHEGYLDRLYVHKNYQLRGVALRLIKAIEKKARALGLAKIYTDCSITAKIPAERAGFKMVREQTVERKGIMLTNYVMEKKL